MGHQNIFNSAAARTAAERNLKIFNRAVLAAGLIGLGCYVAAAFGSENKAVFAGAAFGMSVSLFSGDYRRKKEILLVTARNDIYTP